MTAGMSLLILGALVAVLCSSQRRIDIRGELSAAEVRGIVRTHSACCPDALPKCCLKFVPVSIRQYIAARLNPIEIIAVPKPGGATVVYRGFDQVYYDKKGKHRWGTASYTLEKNSKGWHEVFIFP
jgi:hypothetical protein